LEVLPVKRLVDFSKMSYIITPPVWFKTKAFDKNSLSEITTYAFSQKKRWGGVGNKSYTTPRVRNCCVYDIIDESIKDLIWPVVREANKLFKFKLSNKMFASVMTYEKDQHYNTWHTDKHNQICTEGRDHDDRVLSLTTLLNTSFSGGVFEFKDESQCNFEQIGDTVIFAPYLQHRVTPVTSGIRHSLVSWIRGE